MSGSGGHCYIENVAPLFLDITVHEHVLLYTNKCKNIYTNMYIHEYIYEYVHENIHEHVYVCTLHVDTYISTWTWDMDDYWLDE